MGKRQNWSGQRLASSACNVKIWLTCYIFRRQLMLLMP